MGSPAPVSGHAPTRDGRLLHLVEAGTSAPGTPTVVFEAGIGGTRSTWAAVQEVVAARARTVAYDRSGFGRSAPDAAPRTLARLGDDLGDLLDHLGAGPFVLVGHSWGGPIVRTVAAARPGQVVGLVLVDPSDEGADLYFDPKLTRQQDRLTRAMPGLARFGLLRLQARRLARRLPPTARAEMARECSTVASARAFQAEVASVTDDLRRLREAPVDVGEVPVTVISGTRKVRLGGAVRAGLIDAHRRRAAGLPGGRHVRAEGSAHMVPFTEPELVAAEVLSLLPPG